MRLSIRLLVGMLFVACEVSAQVLDPIVSAQEPIPGSDHRYISMGSETVNPADGSLSFILPIQPPPGRQLSVPFGIRYSPSEQLYLANASSQIKWTQTTPGPLQAGGWSYLVPAYTAQGFVSNSQIDPNTQSTLYCDGTQNYIFRAPDGTERNLNIANNWPDGSNPAPYCPSTWLDSEVHGWATSAPANYVASGTQPALTVTDPSGTRYQFPEFYGVGGPGDSSWTQPFGVIAQSITDRNGNQVTLSAGPTNSSAGGYSDTLGRPVISWTGLGSSSGDQISVAGMTGNIVVRWTSVILTLPETSQYVSGSGNGGCGFLHNSVTLPAVSEIDLPNGTHYSFTYGTFGRVSQITFPSGGYVRYVWGTNFASAATYQVFPLLGPFVQGEGNCQAIFDTAAITDRYVSYDGSAEVLHQHFDYATTWQPNNPPSSLPYIWSSKRTTVTNYDLISGQTTITIYNYSSLQEPVGPNDSSFLAQQIPGEQSILYQDNTGKTLETVNKSWMNVYSMMGEQTILDNGQGTTTLRCYDRDDRVLDTYEYSFQSDGAKPADPNCASLSAPTTLSSGLNPSAIGPLLRHTAIVYHNFANAHLINEPDSVSVYDGSGNPVSQTTYGYTDSVSASPSPTATGLVAAPGSRGNIASISRWVNTSNSWLTTSYTYYENGNVATIKDPANNTTTYVYSDSFIEGSAPGNTNAYVTQITYPTTNGTAHIKSFSYAYSDGQPKQSVDENGQSTSYTYADSMRRLTRIDYPAPFGSMRISYTDTPGAVSVETNRDIDSTHSTDSVDQFDGMLHRVAHSMKNGESTPWDRADTCYDGFGRVRFSSYPFQIASSTTAPNCSGNGDSSVYDALGRIKTLTHSDGSVVTTTYTGRATDVKDEGNGTRSIERISQVDGLGLVRSVCEVTAQSQQGVSPSACGLDASGTGFLTSYSYTALGDLQIVSQGAVSRSFQHDSLSRLTQSSNPETGTIHYSYDLDSNCTAQSSYPDELVSKVDARGVRTCYTYDSLHRLTGKTYITTGTTAANTPAVAYNYDESSHYGRNLTFTVGRRTSQSTAAPNPTGEIFSYDAMGHVIDNSQCTPQNCGNNTAFAVTYPSYDDLGNVLSATNGAGVTLGYSYNVAGRLYSVTSSWNDANHPGTLLDSAHYNSFGSPTSLSIGTLPLTDTRVYSTQRPGWGGWVSSINVGGPSTQSTGTVTVNGSEESRLTGSPAPGTGWVSVSGNEQYITVTYQCGQYTWCQRQQPDAGTTSITVNGVTETSSYGPGSTPTSIASDLAGRINGDPSSPVTATSSGGTVYITARTSGAGTNYSLSASSATYYPQYFSVTSFSVTVSGGTLTGGTDGSYTYDSGTVKLFANGVESDANFGQGSSNTSIAAVLASAVNANNSFVSATASGNIVTLTSRTGGAYTNYSLSASSNGNFSPVSFTASASGSSMGGGTGATLYTLGMSYFNNGDIQTANDSVNGNWSYSYDDFNRLNTAVASNISTGCIESYDRYGNRWSQQPYGGTGYGCGSFAASFGGANNRVDPGEGYSYDAAGNLTSTPDGLSYNYDAEDRIAAVNGGSVASYIYNAEGQRVRRVTASGTVDFLHDLAGHVTSELAVGPVTSIDIRFTNDSCSGCGGGTPVGGGDRNLFVNSISVGTTTIVPTDPSVSYTSAPCNSTQGNVAYILCNGDMISTNPPGGSVESITVNAYGSPDYYVYPHMQIYVNGILMGEWDVTGSNESYTVSAKWNRGEIYAGKTHLATYANGTTYFTHSDWLGDERVRSTLNAGIYSQWMDLPFGEGSNAPNPGPTHFTGKERDAETNLDYFGARYYANIMGRFMTPDWSSMPTAVPYADSSNPQSLNLYVYVRNNPLSRSDSDGHCDIDVGGGKTEHHRGWCIWHTLGFYQTKAEIKQQADQARARLAQSNLMIHGEFASNWIKTASDKDVLAAQREFVERLADGYNWWNWFKESPFLAGVLPIPPGINQSQFGSDVMKWGTGDQAARGRIESLTREELENAGVTQDMAKAWRDFYREVKLQNPGNPSAQGRAELMQRAYELLGGKD